jgi:hypothetical protein
VGVIIISGRVVEWQSGRVAELADGRTKPPLAPSIRLASSLRTGT